MTAILLIVLFLTIYEYLSYYLKMRKILLVLLLVQACWMQVIPSKYMSFDEFRAKFHKKYQPGSVEYEEKKKIY